MSPHRALIENTIEALIAMLDEIDGEPDAEPDPPEEQHDAEAELTWTDGVMPSFYLIAEAARRRGRF